MSHTSMLQSGHKKRKSAETSPIDYKLPQAKRARFPVYDEANHLFYSQDEALNQLKIFNQLDRKLSEQSILAKAALEAFIERTMSRQQTIKVLTKYYFRVLHDTFQATHQALVDFDQAQIFDHFECMVFEPAKFEELHLFSEDEGEVRDGCESITESSCIDYQLESSRSRVQSFNGTEIKDEPLSESDDSSHGKQEHENDKSGDCDDMQFEQVEGKSKVSTSKLRTCSSKHSKSKGKSIVLHRSKTIKKKKGSSQSSNYKPPSECSKASKKNSQKNSEGDNEDYTTQNFVWTTANEERYIRGIKKYGCSWDNLREYMGVGLSNLQVRGKFYNFLKKIKRGDDVPGSAIMLKAHEEAKEKYWTEQEKQVCMTVMKEQGLNWELMRKSIPTKTMRQIKCHTFKKLDKLSRMPEDKLDSRIVEIIRSQKKYSQNQIEWTEEMNERFFKAIETHGPNWEKIAEMFGKTPLQVEGHYYRVTQTDFRSVPEYTQKMQEKRAKIKSIWSKEELESFTQAIVEHGINWDKIQEAVGAGKDLAQCKMRTRYIYERWKTYGDTNHQEIIPTLMAFYEHMKSTRQHWTEEEHQKFLETVRKYGRDYDTLCREIPTKDYAQHKSHVCLFLRKAEQQPHLIDDDEWDVVETLKDMRYKKSYQDDLASSKIGNFQKNHSLILKKCKTKVKKKRLESIVKDLKNGPVKESQMQQPQGMQQGKQ